MQNELSRRTVLQLLLAGAASTMTFPFDSRRRPWLFVTNSEGADIDVIDLERLEVVKDWAVGQKPHGIAAPAGGRVIYTTIESENALKALDAVSGKVIHTLALAGRPNQCAVTPDGKFLAVPIFDGDCVQIVSAEEMKILKTLPIKRPHNCLNAGTNQHMFVTSTGSNQVNMIDLKTLEYMAEIPVGGVPRPIAVSPDERTLYVALSGFHGFVIADIPARQVVRKIEFPALPAGTDLRPLLNTATHGLTVTPDGKELWAASLASGNVYVYDVASGKLSPKIPVGLLPNWIAFSPDSRYACVSNTGSNDCSIVDRQSHKEVARIKVGKAPKRLVAAAVEQKV
ncbi:MAG TPA: beta-propeller fold lactonase family protein [Candidatus Angelobacter sp.]